MIDSGCTHYKVTRKEPNQCTSTEMSSHQQIGTKSGNGERYFL